MKRISAFTLACVFVLLAFVSCGGRKALTADEFVRCAEECGLSYRDYSDHSSNESIEGMIIAFDQTSSKTRWKCTFAVFKDEATAKQVFGVYFNNRFKESGEGVSLSDSERTENYERFKCEVDGQFNCVCRVGNTILEFNNIDGKYRGDAEKLIEKVGY